MKLYKSTIDKVELKRNKSDILKAKISTSFDAYKYVRQFWSEDINIYESFFILLLNRNNNTIGYAKISQGGTAGTVVDISIIAKYALDTLAKSVILAHNHPSGNTSPSKEDERITSEIKQALKLFKIDVLDHLIIGEDKYYSICDETDIL
jgi:DNA repair protein RadC